MMTLQEYLDAREINARQLSIELGVSRQVISYRLVRGHVVGWVGSAYCIYLPDNTLELYIHADGDEVD